MLSLGLDASTTTCGWALTDYSKKIISAGFIDLTPHNTNRQKALAVCDHLRGLAEFSSIDRVNLEASLSGFSGPSSRVTIIKLARFSATLQYVLEDVFGLDKLVLVNATTARKQLFGKARIRGTKPKIFVDIELSKLYDISPWIIKNRIGNIDKRMEDVKDAIVIATYEPNR